ncbi:hypothetical protein C0J52_12571 [Blattella germanica]|nr:hypothetical protein C0J52_12571 [Blattella germanica]
MSQSNERQIVLKNMDFEASGFYSCEVSTETPIYTKPSNDHELLVIRKYTIILHAVLYFMCLEMQREPPHVSTSKHVYQVGETLEANCTTSPARPLAHVTWLVNEKPVSTNHKHYECTVACQAVFADLWLLHSDRI